MTVISDASPIIALENIGELAILKNVFGTVYVTDIVAKEVQFELPSWVSIIESYSNSLYENLVGELDSGEASAIAACLEHKNCLLIIDERKGRKVAQNLGIEIIGLLGVIVKGNQMGLISNSINILEALIEKGFRISEAVETLVRKKLREDF